MEVIVGIVACVVLVAILGGLAWGWRSDTYARGKAETTLAVERGDVLKAEQAADAKKFQEAEQAFLEERNRLNHRITDVEHERDDWKERAHAYEAKYPELAGARLVDLGARDPAAHAGSLSEVPAGAGAGRRHGDEHPAVPRPR